MISNIFLTLIIEENSIYYRKCQLQWHCQKQKGSYKNEATWLLLFLRLKILRMTKNKKTGWLL